MFNTANCLTLSRVFGSIPLAALILNLGPITHTLAVALFAMLCMTDFFDGFFARRWNQVSKFGINVDPFADKVLELVTYVLLLEAREIGALLVIILLVRHFAVTTLRALAADQKTIISARWSGKIRTGYSLVLAFVLMCRARVLGGPPDFWPSRLIADYPVYLCRQIPSVMVLAALWVLAALTLWSLVDYFRTHVGVFRALLRHSPPPSIALRG